MRIRQFSLWLYLALLASLPIVRPFNIRVSGLVVPIADFIFVLCASVWLFELATGRASIRWSWFYAPMALYLVAMLISALASANPRFSAVKLLGKIYLVGLAVLSFNLIRSSASLRRAITAWQVGTVITVAASLLGIVLFYFGIRNASVNLALHNYGSLPPGDYPRLQGLFEYAAMLCNYLNVSLVLALLMWNVGWLGSRAALILGGAIVVTAIFTLTPGLGGFPLVIGLWLWLLFRETRAYVGKLALIAGSAAAVVALLAASVTLFSYSAAGTTMPLAHMQLQPSHRALAWKTAFETFQHHWLFGRGVGMEVASATYVNPSGRKETLTDAHNTYLSVAGESGIVGLLTFGAVIGSFLKRLSPLRLKAPPEVLVKTYLMLAFISAFLYQSFVGSFEDSRHLWVLFGMLAAVTQRLMTTEF